MLRGLPGSGKSTKAKELYKSGGNYYRVNRDHLREMMFFSDHNGKREADVIDIEKLIAKAILVEGHNVIIDDTNLGQKHEDMWKSAVADYNETFPLEKPVGFQILRVDTPIEECIKRDAARERSVGRSVIMGMALQYGYHKPTSAVLCDLDGTLCDIEHRRPFVNQKCTNCGGNKLDGQKCGDGTMLVPGGELEMHGKKDWKSFFDGIPQDSVRTNVLQMLENLQDMGCEIYFVSARQDMLRKVTEDWLEKWVPHIKYKALLMRGSMDRREDSLVKADLLHKYFPDKSVIKLVIDDRPRVVRMWKEEGLEVMDVGDGTEF